MKQKKIIEGDRTSRRPKKRIILTASQNYGKLRSICFKSFALLNLYKFILKSTVKLAKKGGESHVLKKVRIASKTDKRSYASV